MIGCLVSSVGMGSLCTCRGLRMDSIWFRRVLVQGRVQVFYLNNEIQSSSLSCASVNKRSGRSLQMLVGDEASDIFPFKMSMLPLMERSKSQNSKETRSGYLLNVQEDKQEGAIVYSNSAKSRANIGDQEAERRHKIGLANKGKIPWNKGRKHSEETRERIKKRTIEALSDPKVRKKMSEHPHSHSDQSKARISTALKRIWHERLKNKRSEEKFYSVWAKAISESAKAGGYNQQELEWDSYDKMKAEMESKQLVRKAEKARAREIAKLRAERNARMRAENGAATVQEPTEKKKNMNFKITKASEQEKPSTSIRELGHAKSLKVKAQLTKFHQKKKQITASVNIQRDSGGTQQRIVGVWDIEEIKQENSHRRLSLADRIQALKCKGT